MCGRAYETYTEEELLLRYLGAKQYLWVEDKIVEKDAIDLPRHSRFSFDVLQDI